MKKFLVSILILISTIVYSSSSTISQKEYIEVTKIKVLKGKRQLIIYSDQKEIKRYRISLGKQPIGHKEFEGDMKTPEGKYVINAKSSQSNYHKNLGISYPNEQDIAHAKKLGKQPGGDIKIHGLPNGKGWLGKSHLIKDWTYGCIAVTNNEIDELFEKVKIGTPIEILP